jgi:hypothetical protein
MDGQMTVTIPPSAVWALIIFMVGHAIAALIYVLKLESRIQVIESKLGNMIALMDRVSTLTDRLSEVAVRLARIETQLETVISRERVLESMLRDRSE